MEFKVITIITQDDNRELKTEAQDVTEAWKAYCEKLYRSEKEQSWDAETTRETRTEGNERYGKKCNSTSEKQQSLWVGME